MKSDNPRTEQIHFRVTPEEKEALYAAAKLAGMTVTGFVLGQTIGEAIGDAILKHRQKGDNADTD